ncbi:MAG: MBL fold metallo-hydrolase [Pseudomonadota bacterium]
MKIRVAAVCGLLWTLMVSAALHAEQEDATVSVFTLAGPLYLLQGQGGNVLASVGDDGVLLIDADEPQMVEAYRHAIRRLAGLDAVPRLVINTHWHSENTGGNAFWGGQGSVIVGHENVRERLSRQQIGSPTAVDGAPGLAEALPIVTYRERLTFHFNGDTLEIHHFSAGHTDGDSVVFFNDRNLVHLGDLFFRGQFPFVDLASGGSVDGYITSVQAVLERVDEDTVIVPGRGALARRGDLQRYLDMLQATTAEVRQHLADGVSPEDISTVGLDPKWADWGRGSIGEQQWIATILAGS